MKLHEITKTFNELVEVVSDYYKLEPALIEKDYYVTLFLKTLTSIVPNIIFKGGTSLSKCYKVINRFSEDIDLTLDGDCQTQGTKKQIKKGIIEVCESLGLKLMNLDDLRSRRDYNCYKIEYPIKHFSVSIKPILFVETTYITKSYPTELKYATSIIYDYLNETNNQRIIDKYELNPFKIRVQNIERTFIDKVFAICDYAIGNKIEKNSRHIYDIHNIIKKINFNEQLIKLIKDVRNDRKKYDFCYSSKEDVNVPKILYNIIETEIYRKDYESITRVMMYEYVPYEEAIRSIKEIIDKRIFD